MFFVTLTSYSDFDISPSFEPDKAVLHGNKVHSPVETEISLLYCLFAFFFFQMFAYSLAQIAVSQLINTVLANTVIKYDGK